MKLEAFLAAYGTAGLVTATLGMGIGGFAKGVVGFALPLIALSVMASFLPGKTSVALLIMPILVSNLIQALRNGGGEAWGSLRRFWRLNLVFVVVIVLAAQLVTAMSDATIYGVIGLAITCAGASQLLGWRPSFAPRHARLAEYVAGALSGVLGGIAGIWGPPLIMYLLAIRLPKAEMIRAQSITFFLGALLLFFAHLRSGILNTTTLPVSAILVAPTLIGMFIGYEVHDRLDQNLFRKVTLVVLILSGLNLLRRSAGL
ncbi:sulfite exporter TauE/SafE family protein [Amaricoccus solimangrovi]|nr:sulfite exporter TauE/SafE family protein [Amaricoccus solimangrovi]